MDKIILFNVCFLWIARHLFIYYLGKQGRFYDLFFYKLQFDTWTSVLS